MVKVEPRRNEMSGSLAKSSGVTKRVIILKIRKPDEAVKLDKASKSAPINPATGYREKASKSASINPATGYRETASKSAPINPATGYREKVRKELEEAFSRVPIEADDGVKADATARDPVRAAALVESAMFKKIGWSNGIKKAKYRSVLFNLSDPENPDLRRKVLLGEIVPEVLVTMSADEMASQKRQREIIQIQLKSLNKCVHDADEKEKASTDMFQCSRCRERKCTYYQLQTRSADEPMTTYVTCVNCNKHWKF